MNADGFDTFRTDNVALLESVAATLESRGLRIEINGFPFLGDTEEVARSLSRWLRKTASTAKQVCDYPAFLVHVDRNALRVAERLRVGLAAIDTPEGGTHGTV